jgi:hypothetical protein
VFVVIQLGGGGVQNYEGSGHANMGMAPEIFHQRVVYFSYYAGLSIRKRDERWWWGMDSIVPDKSLDIWVVVSITSSVFYGF